MMNVALQPHADAGEEDDAEGEPRVAPHFLHPEKLHDDAIAEDHDVPGEPVGAANAVVEEGVEFVRAAAEVGGEEFHAVDVGDEQRHQQDEAAAEVDVAQGDEIAEPVILADRHEQGDEHAEAAVDRADAEVGDEDGAVPAGDDGGGEVAGDDGAGGDDEQRGDAREHEVAHLVVGPLARAAAPAEAEDGVEVFPDLVLHPVAHGGGVGDEADVPEHDRDGKIGGDGEDVPEQRAAEVGPDAVAVRDGPEIPGEPDAADVDGGIDAGAHDGEDGHGLGGAVDAGGPALAREIEDGGDHRPGVADAYPRRRSW